MIRLQSCWQLWIQNVEKPPSVIFWSNWGNQWRVTAYCDFCLTICASDLQIQDFSDHTRDTSFNQVILSYRVPISVDVVLLSNRQLCHILKIGAWRAVSSVFWCSVSQNALNIRKLTPFIRLISQHHAVYLRSEGFQINSPER